MTDRIRASFTFTEDRLAELQAVVPEAFEDGRVNWETLREALGDFLTDTEVSDEHFGLNWPGKRAARRLAAKPSHGTLIPASGEGVNEATTGNLFIEGDNLEVLKLLQKSYAGRIKMIYIDPPYNTGNDFIYKDDYSEPLDAYLRRSGQKGEKGELLTSNPKSSGRYHTNWLNMIYPRIRLARTLLSDDGFIFISIDDGEYQNLRSVADEVFGSENYLTTLYIQVRYSDKTLVQDADFHKMIEMVIVYRRSESAILNKITEGYSLEKFVWSVLETSSPEKTYMLGDKRVEVFTKSQYKIIKENPSRDGLKEIWATGKILDGNSSGRFFRDYLMGRYTADGYGILYKVYDIGGDKNDYRYFTGPNKIGATKGKYYQGVPSKILDNLEIATSTHPVENFYNFADSFGNCRHEGNIDFRNGKKPVAFVRSLLKLGESDEHNDIILDFFAGSASTAQAVLQMNRADDGCRNFILVQLPCPAENTEFDTITELGKERIRRVINKMKSELQPLLNTRETPEDLGFKVFKLALSHFKAWKEYEGEDLKAIQGLFDDQETPLVEGWTAAGLQTEILLTEGFPLDSKIELQPQLAENVVSLAFSPACEHRLWICLDAIIQEATLQALTLAQGDKFVCLDSAIDDNAKIRLTQAGSLKTI